MPAGLTDLQQKQLDQVDDLLQEGSEQDGFAKDLFFGRFREDAIFPFPEQDESQQKSINALLDQLKAFCVSSIDSAAIDREQKIPAKVVNGLGQLGILGLTADNSLGGGGRSQQDFCRVMEILGSHCASTAALANAQQAVGLKAIELYGSDAQKEKWIKPIADGAKTVAFALTETMAGSDINNVRTRAQSVDGETEFSITGEKRWITNGGVADVLIVMARTPDHANPDGEVTAFLVTPDMAGFEVEEERLEKTGVRGIPTGNVKLNGVSVTVDDIIGELGKGMDVATTVLAYSRMSMAAAAVGSSKFCIERMVSRANSRHQFGKTLGEFELVRKKIAHAVADCYAIESATQHLANGLDGNEFNCEIEAAMVKVFASEKNWRIVNDCFQIWGGSSVFTDQPFERLVRDARVNLIGDCANDVLRVFISLVGFRHLSKDLSADEAGWVKRLGVMSESLTNPTVTIKHDHMTFFARGLAKQIGQFSWQMKLAISNHKSKVYGQQYAQGRLADLAIELFMASCVYARISEVVVNGTIPQSKRDNEFKTAQLYLRMAYLRNEQRLEEIKQNCDKETDAVAEFWLDQTFDENWVIKPDTDAKA